MTKPSGGRQWRRCDAPEVGLARPAQYQDAEFTLTRGPRTGDFEVVGCGIGAKASTVYGGQRTGMYAIEYEGGKVAYAPKKWVSSTFSRVSRAAAKNAAPDPRQPPLPFPPPVARSAPAAPSAAPPAPPSAPPAAPTVARWRRAEIDTATSGDRVIQWADLYGSWAVTHAVDGDGIPTPLWVLMFQPTRRVMGKPFLDQREAREYLLEAVRLAPGVRDAKSAAEITPHFAAFHAAEATVRAASLGPGAPEQRAHLEGVDPPVRSPAAAPAAAGAPLLFHPRVITLAMAEDRPPVHVKADVHGSYAIHRVTDRDGNLGTDWTVTFVPLGMLATRDPFASKQLAVEFLTEVLRRAPEAATAQTMQDVLGHGKHFVGVRQEMGKAEWALKVRRYQPKKDAYKADRLARHAAKKKG